MATTTPQAPATPQGDPEFLAQLLIELGQIRAEKEALLLEKREREAAAAGEEELERKRNAEAMREVCKCRWVMQPQGRTLIGNRVYTGRGPRRDRSTGRIVQHGSTFMAPADHARVLEESGYAEIIEGREHVTNWTPPDYIPEDAAPAPAPGDSDGWKAREVVG